MVKRVVRCHESCVVLYLLHSPLTAYEYRTWGRVLTDEEEQKTNDAGKDDVGVRNNNRNSCEMKEL